jgi:hypothetical protein
VATREPWLRESIKLVLDMEMDSASLILPKLQCSAKKEGCYASKVSSFGYLGLLTEFSEFIRYDST